MYDGRIKFKATGDTDGKKAMRQSMCGRVALRMEKHILIVTTTHDFLWKFERDNVDLLQRMGYVVHYAANLNEAGLPFG